jgi:putative acetyltransferase
MNVRRATRGDRPALVEIWHRSVRATHSFLSASEIEFYLPLTRDYLASTDDEIWVLCDDNQAPVGFMTLAGNKLEALFIAPEYHRRGGGRRLVEHAKSLQPNLVVDVNEQNVAAHRFYEACGFVVEGRSELDSTGRAHPLLHLRLATPSALRAQ